MTSGMPKYQDPGRNRDEQHRADKHHAESNGAEGKSPTDPKEYGGTGPHDGIDTWGGPAPGTFAGKYPPPKVPANGGESGGTVRVSTEALKTFAQNLRALKVPLEAALKSLDAVMIAPGSFYDAAQLRDKVYRGPTSIKITSYEFLRNAIEAITKIAEQTEKLAAAYATAEELNAATGIDVGEYLADAKVKVTAAIGRATV